MPDYIPAPDGDFDSWQNNFVTFASANLAALGLVAADLVPVTTAQAPWTANFATHITQQAAAIAATKNKDLARLAYIATIRPLVRRLQASSAVSDAEKASLGITVPDGEGTPVGPPTTLPVVKVECGARLQHTIHFTDSATPTRKARPPGVTGAQIWLALTAIGAPTPTNPDVFDFVALDTRTPYTLDFDGADGGKNANYLMRWVNTRGEHGPWSETASATIGA